MNGHHHLTNGDTDPPSHIKQLKNTQLANSILIELNERRQSRQFTDVILSVDQEDLHCHRYVSKHLLGYLTFTDSISLMIFPWIIKLLFDTKL